jgi:NAD(P)H-flavin reductase
MTTLTAAPPPASVWQPHVATVRGIRPETPGVQTYELLLDDPGAAAGFRFRPGQFNMLYVPGAGEAAISISSDPGRPEVLGHTVRAAGNVTGALARLGPGGQVGVRGPYGTGWPVEACRGQDVVLAAGGVGLAPLRPVLYHLLRHRGDYGRVILLYGARTPGDLLYAGEYDAWRAGGIEVDVTVDIGGADWHGHLGVVPVLFHRLRLYPPRTRLLTCGPEVMLRCVVAEALARHLRPEYLYLSLERNMSCAVGLCGHCQLGPWFVCKDGPVLTYRQLRPYLRVEDL